MTKKLLEKTVVVQFRVTGLGIGTGEELDWRHELETELDDLLSEANLGMGDGGQGGAGTMEVFLYVDDIAATVELVKQYLTDQEWIGFCKIVSSEGDADWVVHYPPGATFSMWEF